jgi:hypothetical protein
MYGARMRLMKLEVASVLPAALHGFDGRGVALRLVESLPGSWTDRFVSDLLRLAVITHSEIRTVRRLLYDAGPDRFDQSIGSFTRRVIHDPACTREVHRRLVELLNERGRMELLRKVLEAAAADIESDIREVVGTVYFVLLKSLPFAIYLIRFLACR